MEIVHRLQQDVGTDIGASIGTDSGIRTSGTTGTSIGESAQGMDYCLTTYVLDRFQDKIYVPKTVNSIR